MSTKIVIKKPTAASASLAVAAPTTAPKKVVVKTSAPAPKKIVQKVVYVEEEVEEEAPAQKTPQQIYEEIQVLLNQLVQVSGGKKVKGLKKDGTPRAKRTNNSGWNQFVKQFRDENPGVSWKDAMVLCKADWKALKGEDASVQEEEEEEEVTVVAAPAPAPKPAPKKLVVAKSGARPAAPAKTAAQILAEAKAKAKAEAEAAAAAAEAPEVEVDEFEWEGQTLQKNAEGYCWRVDESGDQVFIGRWDAEEEKMDESAEEPTYGSA